jgi:hypothetical protein
VCAADNEPAKYHFDLLMRKFGEPWALGEVLSGGIGGWVHRFAPGGPCYGCVASYLQRTAPGDPAAPAPDYNNPGGPIQETTVPAPKASIDAIAALHASVTLEVLEGAAGSPAPPPPESPSPPVEPFTSLLLTLRRVPGVFDQAYRTYRFAIPRSLTCLICSAGPAATAGPAGEDLDAALDQALARLGDV